MAAVSDVGKLDIGPGIAGWQIGQQPTPSIIPGTIPNREYLTTSSLAPVSPKSQELFGPEKPFVKLQSACFEKLIF